MKGIQQTGWFAARRLFAISPMERDVAESRDETFDSESADRCCGHEPPSTVSVDIACTYTLLFRLEMRLLEFVV